MPVLLLSFVVALADQGTKYLARRHLPGNPIDVSADFFCLRFVRNTGAAWGILQGLNDWLVVLSFLMLACLIVFRRSLLTDTRLHRAATGLMIGGIAGNLVDRVRLGYVVDFIDLHWRQGWHFPAFNVADSAICVGVGLYMISQFRAPPQRREPASPA
jgi:signal peptidase II